jgi:NAD(P)-dependent dehydrogenase (short-subunit alcohol dehydrogenase family)
MNSFRHRTAVITGAASGFGLEVARLAAREGMNVVMADLQAEALQRSAHDVQGLGAEVLALRVDVSAAAQVEALGAAVKRRFGAPHVVFNNAGVAAGGLIWEHSADEWDWVLGVNLMGVVHGVRVFTPMMLEAARAHADYEGHIVNTASMAGLLSKPNMGAYNVSKHAVVALSETLYQDLALVSDRVSASVLCPYFVPTAIHESQRRRPAAERQALTHSQRVAQAMTDKAVAGGKVTAAQVAQCVFDALRARRFYIYSHPQALSMVQVRLDDVVQGRNPSDPFAAQPAIGEHLRKALRGG